MKIIVDGFGGDNAPLEILKGCRDAVSEYGCEIIVTGRTSDLLNIARQNEISLQGIEIFEAPDVISMEDDPVSITKQMKNSSMAVGLTLLKEGKGQAFVSAGSTGALLVGATFIVKRIKGVKRAALASVLPGDKGPFMLLDCGANVECRPEMLTQFGIMGSVYMEKVMKCSNPRVGLINVGTEETKGDPLRLEAYKQLSTAPVNFIGNTEARDLLDSVCDVAVCDGFTGNIALKLTEGVSQTLMKNIKEVFSRNTAGKIAAAMVMKGLKAFKKKMDYNEYGGAPLLGISAPVFKAHGSSKSVAIKNAIRVAAQFAETDIIENVAEKMKAMSIQQEEA